MDESTLTAIAAILTAAAGLVHAVRQLLAQRSRRRARHRLRAAEERAKLREGGEEGVEVERHGE